MSSPASGPKAVNPTNAVAVHVDERLHEPTSLRKGPGAPCGVHRHGCEPVSDAFCAGLRLVQANARQFRIDENAVGNQPVLGAATASVQVLANDVKIVLGYVSEVWAARALSQRPYVWRCGFQTIVYPDVPLFRNLDSRLLKTDAFVLGVRPSATRMSVPSRLRELFPALDSKTYPLTGKPCDTQNVRV